MTVQLQTAPCLWCQARRYQASVEHVFPEALGCAPTYVLETGVCRLCNNRFGRLDMALVSQFELPAWMAGTPRKGGRPPSVDTWAPLATGLGQNGPELYVNVGPGDMMVGRKRLKPASATTGVTNAAFEVHGGGGDRQLFSPDRP